MTRDIRPYKKCPGCDEYWEKHGMLSGPIMMNDVVIGEWTATHTRDYEGYRDYWCTLWYRGTDGYLYEAEWDMWGRHHKDDGAISLAAKVLQQGMKEARKKKVKTE